MTRDKYGDAYKTGFVRTVRFLTSRGAPGETAQEIAQSAWAKGWERLGQLRDESMIVTWVNAIALNAYRSSLRKESFYREFPELPARPTSFAAIDVERILRFCDRRGRTLLQLQMQGLTNEEIAKKEGVTTTAIRIRLLRARRKIGSEIAARNVQTLHPAIHRYNAA